jgi:hypothetical protein
MGVEGRLREAGSADGPPLDTLPSETIERLRAGGELSPAELAIVQAAALRDAGPFASLVQAARPAEETVILGRTAARRMRRVEGDTPSTTCRRRRSEGTPLTPA